MAKTTTGEIDGLGVDLKIHTNGANGPNGPNGFENYLASDFRIMSIFTWHPLFIVLVN